MTEQINSEKLEAKIKEAISIINDLFLETNITSYEINGNMVNLKEKNKTVFTYTINEIMEDRY